MKRATATKCSPKGGCSFEITVTNTSDTTTPVDVPIVIDEAIDAPQATLTSEPAAPWTCSKAAPFTCTHPGPLAAKGSFTLLLTFAPNTPPETKAVKNCAGVVPPTATPAGQSPPAQPPPVKDDDPGTQKPLRRMNLGGSYPEKHRICKTGVGRREICVVIEDVGNPAFVHFHIEPEMPKSYGDYVYNVRQGDNQWERKAFDRTYIARDTDVSIQYCHPPHDLGTGTRSCAEWNYFKLSRLSTCEQYEDDATAQAEEMYKNYCNLGGGPETGVWDRNKENHFNWCYGLSDSDFQTAPKFIGPQEGRRFRHALHTTPSAMPTETQPLRRSKKPIR